MGHFCGEAHAQGHHGDARRHVEHSNQKNDVKVLHRQIHVQGPHQAYYRKERDDRSNREGKLVRFGPVKNGAENHCYDCANDDGTAAERGHLAHCEPVGREDERHDAAKCVVWSTNRAVADSNQNCVFVLP